MTFSTIPFQLQTLPNLCSMTNHSFLTFMQALVSLITKSLITRFDLVRLFNLFYFQMEEILPLLQGLDVRIRLPYPLYGTQSVIPDPPEECTIQTRYQDSVFRIPTTRPCVNVRVQRLPAVSWTPLNQKHPRHPHLHW